jgi:glucokinase
VPVEYVVAVDLGGTLTKLGRADAAGDLHEVTRMPTRFVDGAASVPWLAGVVASAAAAPDCRGYSVVVPGIIDSDTGIVRAAPNVGWINLPLRAKLDRFSGLRGVVGHDVRAAGLAEWRLGAATGADNGLVVILGTGVAAAAIVDSRLLDAGGYAGELGHLAVPAAADRACACGQRGCLETICSAPGLRRTYAALSQQPAGDALEVTERARRGEAAAVKTVALAIEGLAEALAAAVTLLGSELIVIGGGLAGAFDLMHDDLAAHLDAQLSFQRRPRLAVAALGADAGLVGAGLIGWEHLLDHRQGSR